MTARPGDHLWIYGGSGEVFQLLARQEPVGPEGFDEVLRRLLKRPELQPLFPSDEPSDPGRILLETFALLHWNVLNFLQGEGRELLAAALALTGLQSRPAWPAAAVFQVKPDGPAELTTWHRTEPTAEAAKQLGIDGETLTFQPAWPSFVHPLDEQDREAVVVLAKTRLSREQPLDLFIDLPFGADPTL